MGLDAIFSEPRGKRSSGVRPDSKRAVSEDCYPRRQQKQVRKRAIWHQTPEKERFACKFTSATRIKGTELATGRAQYSPGIEQHRLPCARSPTNEFLVERHACSVGQRSDDRRHSAAKAAHGP